MERRPRQDGQISRLEEEKRFRLAVQQGVAEADAGNFIEEREMDRRFEGMMRG